MNNVKIQTFNVTKVMFFRVWLIILQPFLKLRNKELDLLASLLYHRHLISIDVKNKDMLDELLFSVKIKKKIMKELGIPEYAYNNLLSTLRKKGIILDKTITRQIIPVIEGELTNFKLLYDINVKD